MKQALNLVRCAEVTCTDKAGKFRACPCITQCPAHEECGYCPLEGDCPKNERVGYCEECGSEVLKKHAIPNYARVYECPSCKHPNNLSDLWDEVPDYLKNKGDEK
jgi:hypothetical protein